MSILIDEKCPHGYPVGECDDCAGVVYTPTTDDMRWRYSAGHAALVPEFDRWYSAERAKWEREVLEKAVQRALNWWATDAGDICLDDCSHRECRAARACVAAVRGEGA